MILPAHRFLLRRRRAPRGPVPGARRWADFARAVRARHGSAAARRAGLALVLLRRPTGALHLSTRRWELKSWTLSPRIVLNVGAPTVGPLRLLVTRPARADARTESARPPDARAWLAPTRAGGLRAAAGVPARGAPRHVGGQGAAVGRRHASAVIELLRAGRFRRVEPRELESRRPASAPATERPHPARAARRVERTAQAAPPGVVVRAARPWREEPARAGGPDEERGGPRGTQQRGAPAAPFTAAAPPIDIQRLTDEVIRQIDSRILAHKERLGKLF